MKLKYLFVTLGLIGTFYFITRACNKQEDTVRSQESKKESSETNLESELKRIFDSFAEENPKMAVFDGLVSRLADIAELDQNSISTHATLDSRSVVAQYGYIFSNVSFQGIDLEARCITWKHDGMDRYNIHLKRKSKGVKDHGYFDQDLGLYGKFSSEISVIFSVRNGMIIEVGGTIGILPKESERENRGYTFRMDREVTVLEPLWSLTRFVPAQKNIFDRISYIVYRALDMEDNPHKIKLEYSDFKPYEKWHDKLRSLRKEKNKF